MKRILDILEGEYKKQRLEEDGSLARAALLLAIRGCTAGPGGICLTKEGEALKKQIEVADGSVLEKPLSHPDESYVSIDVRDFTLDVPK